MYLRIPICGDFSYARFLGTKVLPPIRFNRRGTTATCMLSTALFRVNSRSEGVPGSISSRMELSFSLTPSVR
jgi:hypothetical protein